MVLRNEAIQTGGLLPGFEKDQRRTYEVDNEESANKKIGLASNGMNDFDEDASESI